MKYAVYQVCASNRGIGFRDTLEKAKDVWASMYKEIYEITDEQIQYIKENNIKNTKAAYEYILNNCKFVWGN